MTCKKARIKTFPSVFLCSGETIAPLLLPHPASNKQLLSSRQSYASHHVAIAGNFMHRYSLHHHLIPPGGPPAAATAIAKSPHKNSACDHGSTKARQSARTALR